MQPRVGYRVIYVKANSCCSPDIKPQQLEEACNNMAAQGFYLKEGYLDNSTGCCGGPKKSATLIFGNY